MFIVHHKDTFLFIHLWSIITEHTVKVYINFHYLWTPCKNLHYLWTPCINIHYLWTPCINVCDRCQHSVKVREKMLEENLRITHTQLSSSVDMSYHQLSAKIITSLGPVLCDHV